MWETTSFFVQTKKGDLTFITCGRGVPWCSRKKRLISVNKKMSGVLLDTAVYFSLF